MATPRFDRDRAVRILVDAAAIGDAKACESWKISLRTLQNYRARLAGDPELSQAFAQKRTQLDNDWRIARRRFLNAAIAKVQVLVDQAGPDQIRDVVGAIKIIGDLEVAAGVLGERTGVDQQGQAPAEDAGAGSQEPPSVH